MQFPDLYAEHVGGLRRRYEQTLQQLAEKNIAIEAVLLHSGSRSRYFADDAEHPFRPNAHFAHWLPVGQADQMVLFRPGAEPVYFHVEPASFWTDNAIPVDPAWAEAFEIVDLGKAEEVLDHLGALRRIAFLGQNTEFAARIGMPAPLHNETNLRNALNHHRSVKTAYEIAVIREANRIARIGHDAARDAFLDGASEQDVHLAYLAGCGCLEHEMPFETIIGIDDRSAVLHYQRKRKGGGGDGQVLLVDAGYRLQGYASDITRTHARESVHPVFRRLVDAVRGLKDDLIAAMKPGITFKEIEEQAHRGTARVLVELDLARGEPDELVEKKVSNLFLPHGLGHFLGIQVHDVGGVFKDETGILEPPAHEQKELRRSRPLVENMLFTIEPGIYFIPMLLRDKQHEDKQPYLNLPLIETLIPLGGVRFEDNVVLCQGGVENLTP